MPFPASRGRPHSLAQGPFLRLHGHHGRASGLPPPPPPPAATSPTGTSKGPSSGMLSVTPNPISKTLCQGNTSRNLQGLGQGQPWGREGDSTRHRNYSRFSCFFAVGLFNKVITNTELASGHSFWKKYRVRFLGASGHNRWMPNPVFCVFRFKDTLFNTHCGLITTELSHQHCNQA